MNRTGVVALIILTALAFECPLAGQGIGCPIPCELAPGDSSDQEFAAIDSNPAQKTSLSELEANRGTSNSIKPVGTGTGVVGLVCRWSRTMILW